MDTTALQDKQHGRLAAGKKKRRRAWPTAADDHRIEAITLFLVIRETAEQAGSQLASGDVVGLLHSLKTIQDKARTGQIVLNTAKDL